MKYKLTLQSLAQALGVLVYTSGVAWLMYNGKQIFGQTQTFAAPLAFLLLFVLSATIVGLLVLGRPVYLYMNGEKKEALKLLFYTIGWLIIITVLILITQFK